MERKRQTPRLVSLTAEQSDILRLKQEVERCLAELKLCQEHLVTSQGELKSCHKSYLAKTEQLAQIKVDLVGMTKTMTERTDQMGQEIVAQSEEIAKQSEIIAALRADLQKQEPRLDAVRSFLVHMQQMEEQNHHPQAQQA